MKEKMKSWIIISALFGIPFTMIIVWAFTGSRFWAVGGIGLLIMSTIGVCDLRSQYRIKQEVQQE